MRPFLIFILVCNLVFLVAWYSRQWIEHSTPEISLIENDSYISNDSALKLGKKDWDKYEYFWRYSVRDSTYMKNLWPHTKKDTLSCQLHSKEKR